MRRLHTLGFFVLTVLVLTVGIGFRFYNHPQLNVGSIAPSTLRAPASVQIEDKETTQQRQDAARSGASPIWMINSEANKQIHQNLDQLFDYGESIRASLEPVPFVPTSVLSSHIQIYLRQVNTDEWQMLLKAISLNRSSSTLHPNPKFNPTQQQALKQFHVYAISRSLTDLNALIRKVEVAREGYRIALVTLQPSFSEAIDPFHSSDSQDFLNLTHDEWQITKTALSQTLDRMLAQGIYPGIPKQTLSQAAMMQVQLTVPKQSQLIAHRLLMAVLSPNLMIDLEQTTLNAKQAEQSIERSLISIEKGQVIVQEGQKITQSNFVLLDHFKLIQRGIDWLGLLGFSGLVSLAIALFQILVRRLRHQLRWQDQILILLLLLSASIILRLFNSFTALPAIGLLLGSFYGAAIGMTLISLQGLLLLAGTHISLRILMPSLVAGLFGAMMAGRWHLVGREAPKSREELAVLGVVIGLIQAATYWLINTAIAPLWFTTLSAALMNGFVGMAWSIVALGLSPYLERLFDIVTPIRLAELSNPNRPLLQRLAHETPGTFQHTLLVTTLAEAAARELSCNVELVRAGTLYHDIGKMHAPLYFIENQMGGPNPHDTIADPWKSTEIIKQHVSAGLMIARQYRLPTAIQAFIPEHQGTILIAYFYHQAKTRLLENLDQPGVEESDFRYAGPIPQSRETGIVMLADACEAAMRSLEDATPESALVIVNKILKARWKDQQLVDSGLTRSDLNRIAIIFVEVWQQFHHKRIAYPKGS